jgi:hypothetical protein
VDGDWLETSGELGGLAEMIAGLIRGNVNANPERKKYLTGRRGTINIRAHDVGESVALTLGSGRAVIGARPHDKPDVEILADSGALMSFSTVPLRLGFPDAMTPDGRSLTKDILKRKVIVRGLVTHPNLVRRLQSLLTVT